MALSSFFSDDEVISQLRMYFDLEVMWSIDFKEFLDGRAAAEKDSQEER